MNFDAVHLSFKAKFLIIDIFHVSVSDDLRRDFFAMAEFVDDKAGIMVAFDLGSFQKIRSHWGKGQRTAQPPFFLTL